MKASNLFLFFVLFSLLSTGYFFSSANAVSEVSHFYAENTVCDITTTSEEVIDIEDGIDFDFEDGHDYLIVATSTWGGEENAETYEINLMHNSNAWWDNPKIIKRALSPFKKFVSLKIATEFLFAVDG